MRTVSLEKILDENGTALHRSLRKTFNHLAAQTATELGRLLKLRQYKISEVQD